MNYTSLFLIAYFSFICNGHSFLFKESDAKSITTSLDGNLHYFSSLKRTTERLGISTTAYIDLFKSLNLYSKTAKGSSLNCLKKLSDTTQNRSSFVTCLSQIGIQGFNQALFRELSSAKWHRIQSAHSSTEEQKTIALLAYLEDLTRESLEMRGINTSWWSKQDGFTNFGINQADFDFKDGDVLLLIGNSSISSLITQATDPQRRFSHALMIRKKSESDFSTLEALIEKGVTSGDKKKFSNDTLQTVVVLRWKNKQHRSFVASKASDCAYNLYKNKTPYNFAMDLNDTTTMFCSQLVAHCYAQASGVDLKSLIPQMSSIRSDKVFEYLKNMGVQSKIMPSPGDLATSTQFEMVAEFRNVRNKKGKLQLARMWNMFILGDVFVERLELGQKIRFDTVSSNLLRPLLDISNFTLATFGGSIFGRDVRY